MHYHPDDARNVDHIVQVISDSYELTTQNLGISFTGKLDIYLAHNGGEFGNLTGWQLKPWVQGVAYPGDNKIVLKSPRWSGSQVDLGRAAVHEFVHILLGNEIGRIPRWLNEGLAVMLSGEIYFDDKALVSASMRGKFLSFDQIEKMMSFNKVNAALGYQQSLSATQYFVSEFGWLTVQRLLSNIKSGMDFDEAFFQATGLYVWEFELEWEQNRGKMHKLTFLKDLDHYLSFVFGPLVLLAGLLLWLRRRRIKRRWAMEEKYDEMNEYLD